MDSQPVKLNLEQPYKSYNQVLCTPKTTDLALSSRYRFKVHWQRRKFQSGSLVENMATSSQEAIIAVMGASGVGKSSFIRLVTNDNSILVGETLHSGT